MLRATGAMARRVHGVVDVDVGTARHRSGGVLLHGDFGPQNLLFGGDDMVVVGVLDWEFVHFGDALEDLMWAEWIVRTHHPEQVGHLGEMYIVYGRCWSWADRQRAMVGRCDNLRKRSHGPARDLWTRRLNNTSRSKPSSRPALRPAEPTGDRGPVAVSTTTWTSDCEQTVDNRSIGALDLALGMAVLRSVGA